VEYVVTDECTACGACLLTCPQHAITASLPLQIKESRCTDCGECIEVCPRDAIVRTA
jgi:NAD-dependent dihydropyrimidine dehydrogenase PreA subunit